MKCNTAVKFAAFLCYAFIVSSFAESIPDNVASASSTDLSNEASVPYAGAGSVFSIEADKHKQEKRYIYDNGYSGYGGYGGYGGYSGYGGLGGYSGLGGVGGYGGLGYGGYSGGYSGYGGYGNGPYGGYGSPYSYYNARYGFNPYSRFGYNSPSSYYPSNYANSIVGGGFGSLGGVGGFGGVAPTLGAGYQYGPGISGTVY